MALVGNAYIQASSSDPGAVGFGYTWLQTDTGSIYYRNSSNTAWVLAGNTDQTYQGLLSRQGGTMTGAILGAHGLMPTSGGDFSVAPTIQGSAIATQAYIDSAIASLQSSVSSQIAAAIASIPGLTVGAKLAAGSGVLGPYVMSPNPSAVVNFTVPLPQYSDGTYASQTEVNGRYSAWALSLNFADNHVSDASNSFVISEPTPNTRNFQMSQSNTTGITISYSLYIGYVIIGIRG